MKCFYHNDMDGRCAGAIVAFYERNKCAYSKNNFFEIDYIMDLSSMLNKVSYGEKVYFVDYSFTEGTKWVLDSLLEKNCRLIWIDHHASSLNLVTKYSELSNIKGLRQEGISGAALTYMYLYQKTFEDCPLFIELVSDYDCWIFKHGRNAISFKLGLETYDYDALDRIWINLLNGASIYQIVELGYIIKQYIDNNNQYHRDKYAYESIIAGNKALVINRESNSWIFGEKYDEYPLVCVWVFDGEKYHYSLFSSNKEVDCSKIAESYGGGGHKGAAGFSSDKLLFTKI